MVRAAPGAPGLPRQDGTTTPGVGPEELVDVWPDVVRLGWFAAGFLAVALIGWYVVAPAVTRAVHRRNRNNPTLQEAISRYVRLVVLLVAAFVAAAVAGYGQFLTDSALVVAAGTLAVGVAAQSVIGSLVSGVVLVLDPEFNVGNYIEWADGEGTVQSITLRVTRVLTQDGELVTIPNTMLTSQAITRPFGRGRYRVTTELGLGYDADVDEALAVLEAVAREHDEVLDEPSPTAYVDDLGDDAVVLRAQFWIQDPQRRDLAAIESSYARRAAERLGDAGIAISPAARRELEGRIEVDGSSETPIE